MSNPMQNRSQPSQMPSELTGRLIAESVEGISRAIALTVEVFLHCGFGSRYVGCGFVGIPIIFCFALHFADQHPLPLLCYLAAYGVMWLIAAICTLIRCWGGRDTVHSRYTGRPYLWRLLPNWNEENVKHGEAVAVILLGYAIHHFNRPLGDYLMIAAALVLLRGYSLVAQRRERAIQMKDSVIEQGLIAERFHDMQP
jgi:hypothetical protein